MNHAAHRIAGAGNVAALLLLVLFLGNGGILLEGYGNLLADDRDVGSRLATLPDPAPRANRVILVVIDGLRTDVAADPQVMPFLCSLTADGGHATAQVESMIPSTIAGIISLSTGHVPAPASFVFDFGSPAAKAGGIFEAVADSGGECFVAGPQLWLDLYGTWIASWHVTSEFGGNDAAVLTAGLQAMQHDANRLLVLHFGEPDTAAHLHGGVSQEYREAVSRCDDALRQMVARMPADSCILITSDHGVTDAGSHAGPEPDVLSTPLIVDGPGLPTGQIPDLRQRDVPRLVLTALGLAQAPSAATGRVAGGERFGSPIGFAVLVAIMLYCGSRLASRLRLATPVLHRYIALINATVWVTLGLVVATGSNAALALSAAVVCVVAFAGGRRPTGPVFVALALGAILSGLRLLDALLCVRGTGLPPLRPDSGVKMLLIAAVGCLLGRLIGRWLSSAVPPTGPSRLDAASVGGTGESHDFATGLVGGVLLAFCIPLVGRLLGQTYNLSSIETHDAFHVAEGPFGILGAVIVILLREALPTLSVLAGFAPALVYLDPIRVGGLAAGAAAMFIGQAVIVALMLSWLASDQQALASLSLGGFLRVAGELVYFFIAASLLGVRWWHEAR
jgi:hypothetical protein